MNPARSLSHQLNAVRESSIHPLRRRSILFFSFFFLLLSSLPFLSVKGLVEEGNPCGMAPAVCFFLPYSFSLTTLKRINAGPCVIVYAPVSPGTKPIERCCSQELAACSFISFFSFSFYKNTDGPIRRGDSTRRPVKSSNLCANPKTSKSLIIRIPRVRQ